VKLFKIQFDCQDDYVEAENMPDAIGRWHRYRRSHDDQWDEPETPEPDGCALVHEKPVIR
jgi:hypothetical protein